MAIATALVGGAANAIGAVSGLAGAGFSKSSNEITAEVFKQQMRQSKRLWSADWAEASWRHGDQLMQAAQQHAEGQALAAAQYHQAERQFKQASQTPPGRSASCRPKFQGRTPYSFH